jgi:phenylacetate-CoA ligase
MSSPAQFERSFDTLNFCTLRDRTLDLLAPISRHVVAPAWAMWERSRYLVHFRHLLQTQFDRPEIICSRQDSALRAIVEHAWKTSPFWRDRLNTAGLRPSDVATVADLPRLPLLTKADLREHAERMLSCVFKKSDLHKHTTSGSTGVSVVTYRDDDCQQFKRAATLRSDEWSGWRLGERIAAVWGNPQIRTDWKGRLRRALLDRHYLYLDTLKMNEASMAAFVDAMVRTPTSMLFGHAHSLYLLAQYVKSQRPDVRLRPKAILSTCMLLHDFERQLMEEIFARKVTNRYGCEEVSLIACQCGHSEGLHVNADCLVVEILDDRGRECVPGQSGRVVVTDLHNRAMPIVRYEVGDVAAWSGQSCACGRTLPLLANVTGRVADYVVTSSGEYISGISLTENFALQIPGVAQLQIIQEELQRFTFNIVKGPDFGTHSFDAVRRLVRERFGAETRFACHFMERIPQEPSGKYRFCISRLRVAFGSASQF